MSDEIALGPQAINENKPFMRWLTVLMKGTGRWPTSYLLCWSPTWRNPFQFDLLEVMRCETDGGMWTLNCAHSPLAFIHAGHKFKSPKCYSLWEFMKVQLRLIR